ncbi:LOW QUALITY PROTEIN: Solute carrier family 25 member 51, partial [Galemys pyrenaicus]
MESKPGCNFSVEDRWISKPELWNPSPINLKDNCTGTYIWFVEDLCCLLDQYPRICNPEYGSSICRDTEAVSTPLGREEVNHFFRTTSIMKALKCYGIREYYQGKVPVLFQNGFSNAYFGLRGPLKEHMSTAQTFSAQ